MHTTRAVLAAALAVACLAPLGAQSQAVSQRVLLQQVAAYAEAFGREFHGVVAREQYTQVIRPWQGTPPNEPGVSADDVLARREMVADLLLVFEADGPWHLHRDVLSVDDTEVGDRQQRLASLFLEPTLTRRDRLRRMTRESARYNLGDITRTLNVPTFPLIVIHPTQQARFRFRTSAPRLVDGRTIREITFDERQRPTLVRSTEGRNVPLRGQLWVEQGSGELLFARLDPAPADVLSRVQVWFDHVPGLSLRVPVRMWEWYQVDGPIRDGYLNLGTGFTGAYVEALARYDDFRRYAVETREQIVR